MTWDHARKHPAHNQPSIARAFVRHDTRTARSAHVVIGAMVLALSLCLLALTPPRAYGEEVRARAASSPSKHALIIANLDYETLPDIDGLSDVATVTRALTDAGFSVTRAMNLTQETFNPTVENWRNEITASGTANAAVVYYIGHASTRETVLADDTRETFPALIPVDGNTRGISLWSGYLSGSGVPTLFVLDANRPHDPLQSEGAAPGFLMPTDAEPLAGSFVISAIPVSLAGDPRQASRSASEASIASSFAEAIGSTRAQSLRGVASAFLAIHVRAHAGGVIMGDYLDEVRAGSDTDATGDACLVARCDRIPNALSAARNEARFLDMRAAALKTAAVIAPPAPAPAQPEPALPETPPAIAPTGSRVALVVHASDYEMTGWDLENPTRDAALMAASLRAVGFEVIEAPNATQSAFDDALRDFRGALRDAGEGVTALFYFAGHAVQYDGLNYMIPVDADIGVDVDVLTRGVRLGTVLQFIDAGNAANTFVFLDACRNNPLPAAARSAGGDGLVDEPVPDAQNLLIGYATRPGLTASDGLGTANSPYTKALAHYLRSEEPAELMLKRVGACVRELTSGAQQPEFSSGFLGEEDFIFNAGFTEPVDRSLPAFCTQ